MLKIWNVDMLFLAYARTVAPESGKNRERLCVYGNSNQTTGYAVGVHPDAIPIPRPSGAVPSESLSFGLRNNRQNQRGSVHSFTRSLDKLKCTASDDVGRLVRSRQHTKTSHMSHGGERIDTLGCMSPCLSLHRIVLLVRIIAPTTSKLWLYAKFPLSSYCI
jgi:hypothetical protein